ncbi:MAG TPA: T9SS type A sorting domain-containing protein, partial [Bacteroidales bacterium]|nr:T9SS type A sorting domain-containing protein [Bacteroidales bacterium]
TGYIHVRYTVKTDSKYNNCNSTIDKDVYIRPTKLLSGQGYQEDFESGRSGWTRTDSLNIWTFGLPGGTDIKTSASGTHAWYTKNLRKGWVEVESPCFDFSVIERPFINMKVSKFFEKDRDGAVLQYRIGDSKDWINVGTINDGLEWYNSATIRGIPGKSQVGWTSDGPENWIESSHSLDELKGKTNVRFRIAYGSEGKFGNHDGFAFDDISIGERTRKVLIEHFTNVQDRAANLTNATVNSISSANEEDVLNIQYHTGFPSSDPFYEDNPGEANARVLFYGLTHVPYTFVDGGTTNEHAMVFDNVISKLDPNEVTKRTLINSIFRIDYNVVISGNALTIRDITITPLRTLSGTADDREIVRNLTLYLAVTEKENSSYAGNQEHTFRQVFRKFVPDAGGIIIEHSPVWQKGISLDIPEQTWLISNVMNSTSLEVIGWLQNSVSKEIYQAFSVSRNNVTVGIDDTHVGGKNIFTVYPNPARETFTIDFSQPLQAETEIKIYNYRGEIVHNFRAGAGSTRYVIDNPGLRAGLYMVKISSGFLDLGNKKLVILGD